MADRKQREEERARVRATPSRWSPPQPGPVSGSPVSQELIDGLVPISQGNPNSEHLRLRGGGIL